MSGKNINYFLMDGTPSGRVKCTISNWTGVVYRIPRTELEKCGGRDDLRQSIGVYFLFGFDDEAEKSVVYIGQAGVRKSGEGILCRLQEHKRNTDKDYWTEAVAFITSNNSFGPTEISWLENCFCTSAMNANRYIVKNTNEPNVGNVTEEKESELQEFFDYAKIVMGVLGHKIFEPLVVRDCADSTSDNVTFSRSNVPLTMERNGAFGKGIRVADGFIVFKGSRISFVTKNDATVARAKRLREQYAPITSSDGVLQEDILLRSPNEAALFLVGGSHNAMTGWKSPDGRTLGEIENSEVAENDAPL